MILKARSHDGGWVYIDGIKSLHVKHVQYKKYPAEEVPQEEVPLAKEMVDKGMLEPVMLYVIEERENTTRSFVPSEVHGCITENGYYPALELTLGNEEFKNIVIEEGYLLNDNGKTVDKFEPYGRHEHVRGL